MWLFHQPNIGSWYENQEMNHLFEIVAVNDDGSVEIQHFAGEIEGFDLESWNELSLKQIPPPEDCSGPFELSIEELGYDNDNLQPESWLNPLTILEPENDY